MFSPRDNFKKAKGAGLRPLSEDIKFLGITEGDMLAEVDHANPVLGARTRSSAQLAEERNGRGAPRGAVATEAQRKRKAAMESARRERVKIREGVNGTAANRWLKMYGEAKQGQFRGPARGAPRDPAVVSLIEDIQDLVAGASGRHYEIERREYRKAFNQVSETAEMLAQKYQARGGRKNEAVAKMLRAMKSEAKRQGGKLAEAVPPADGSGYDARSIPSDPAKTEPGWDDVGKEVDPDPNDMGTEGELDLQNPSGGIGAGKGPGEEVPGGTEPEGPWDNTPEDMRAEDAEIDLQDPSGDIGKGKKPGEETPTGDEPDWIDPHLRKELDTYVGEGEEEDPEHEEEPTNEDAADGDPEPGEEDPEHEHEGVSHPEDDAPPVGEDDPLMDPVPTHDDVPPVGAEREGMGYEDAAEDPALANAEPSLKEMMRTLSAALDDYQGRAPANENRRRPVARRPQQPARRR